MQEERINKAMQNQASSKEMNENTIENHNHQTQKQQSSQQNEHSSSQIISDDWNAQQSTDIDTPNTSIKNNNNHPNIHDNDNKINNHNNVNPNICSSSSSSQCTIDIIEQKVMSSDSNNNRDNSNKNDNAISNNNSNNNSDNNQINNTTSVKTITQNIPLVQSTSLSSSTQPQSQIDVNQLNNQNIKSEFNDQTNNSQYSPNRSIILFNKSTVLSQNFTNSQQVTFGKSQADSETSSPARSMRSSKSNRSSILNIKPQINSCRSSVEQDLRSANTLYEKKRSRYRFVKSWEDKRIQVTSIFNNIFCDMSDSLVNIATQSNEFIDNLLYFLKDQQIQMAQYAKAPLTQVGEAYMYSPQMNSVSYPSINRIFKQFEMIDTSNSSSHSELSTFIDQSIIRPILLTDKKNFTQKFEAFSTSVKETKAKIVKLAKIAVTSYDEYTNLFKEMVQLQMKGKDIKKDFYYQEVIFMHHAYEHFEHLREFGLQVVRFVEELEQLQMNRTKNIHQALSLYVKRREELIEGLENTDHIKIMLQQLQSNMETHILDIESLLSPEQSNYIKKCYSKEDINMSILKQFAKDFSLKSNSEKNLVVKEFTAEQIEKENNPKKEWRDCSITLTVDNYLIITPGMLDSFTKPSAIIFLPISKTTFQKESMTVTIVETQKKLFWKSKKSYQFRLQHEFDANEITSFLQSNTQIFSQNNSTDQTVILNYSSSSKTNNNQTK